MRLKGGRLFLTTAMMLPMLSSALAADVVISGTKLVVPPKPQLPAAPEIDAPAPKVTAPSPVVAVAAPKPLIPEAKAKPKPVEVKDKAAAAPSVKVKKAAKPDTVAKPAPVVAAKKISEVKKPAGSLYPDAAQKTETTALAKALGAAGYALRDVGVSESFRIEVQRAVGAHPIYAAERANVDQSAANRRRDKAALYPQLSTRLRGDYSLTRDFGIGTDNVVESLRPAEQFTAGISASQLVFDGGTAFQRIKSAAARNEETKNSLSTRIIDLSLGALSAYHDLFTHQALLALGDDYVRRHEKILGDVRERERLGAGSKADVTQTKARLAAAKARVAEIRESERLAEIRFMEFFEAEPGVLARPSFERVAVDTRQAAVSAAVSRHPEIAAADSRAAAREADYRAAKGGRLPQLSLTLDATKFDVFDSGDDFDVRAGVNLDYDLYTGGARRAEIASARAGADFEKHSAENVRKTIARDAAIAFERREGAGERLAALETAVINHDKTRKLVLERYRVARGDLINVLQAENDYFEAGVAYLTGLANRDMAVYQLMEHTGDLLRFFSPETTYLAADTGGARVE